ncbi:chaplin family protein [Streptomyces sioyaensis]|uniref:chaplin n=1 Tax=Streptomyces sioyaensis TaxID=67364 RepID=UPI0037BDA592
MRQSLKACMFVVAASGVLGASCGAAYADAGAGGSTTNAPGVLSGNSIQVTVDTPVNACGNSVDAGAALNPAFGNGCGNGGALPPAARPPLAQAPGVAFRRAPEPVQRRVPEPVQPPDHGPGQRPAGHRAAAPAEAVHKPAGPLAHKPAPRPAPDARVDEVERAGASAGSALLAATGPGALSALAGTGGGLLLGGALLLRRARPRRR